MSYIIEPALKVPIVGDYDVVIAGGGIAGISAALASVRNGAKVLLIEKQFTLGGLATLGLVTTYLPLCDGYGKQVSYGISEELLRLSVKYGFEPSGDYPDKNPKPWLENGTPEEKAAIRYETQFNASLFAILLEQLLLKEGVKLLYGSSVCNVLIDKDVISSLMIENKSGRSAVRAKSFVDCTGDADICNQANVKTEAFKQGNVLASWYYCHRRNQYQLKIMGFCDVPEKYKSKEQSSPKCVRFYGLTGEDLTQMSIQAHACILNDFLKDGGIRKEHAIATIASIPQIRMTRRICGEYTANDTEMHKRFEDSIGMIGDWRKAGPIYEIPFRTLYNRSIKNLIVAGRCISVTDDMWDITRVIPACAVTGEAAGTAAAMSNDFANLNISALQAQLVKQGVKLHEN